jgi:hypothetical protein
MEKITVEQRKQLGLGKKLWSIEVLYQDGNETKRSLLINQTSQEIWNFRQNIFKAGLMVPIDPGRFRLYSPYDILEIQINKQSKYFDP